MKYRIVTNGHLFKVQEKGFFGWSDVAEEIGWGCEHTPKFSDLELAKQFKRSLEAVYFSTAPWRVVDETN